MERTRRLFILGAGCSYAAGLPDGDRLTGHLAGYVGASLWEVVYNKFPKEYWAPLLSALFEAMRETAHGGPQDRWPLDRVFDRFHQRVALDPVAFGPVYGLLFEATAQLLYTRSCYAGTTDAYRTFVEALEPADIILTFNWDLCPEISLHQAGRQFSRVLGQEAPQGMPWLLKLHGSIDYLIVEKGAKIQGGGEPEFLDVLGAEAPSPFPGRYFELARLRTYDLGYEVQLDQVAKRDQELKASEGVVGGYDVGPFLLTHMMEEYPTFHMLTPGSPRVLYDWQYELTSANLATVCPEISEIIVAGYSFPAYDTPVHRVLRKIYKLANKPRTHIVNPAAATIEPKLLKSIFGKCELHACGFADYSWARSSG